MSISEEEQKKAVSVVLSKLRQKDLPGLLAAQRSGKLDEFVSPHLDAYIAKNYPKNSPDGKSSSSPTDTPVREMKRVASKPREIKRLASKPRDIKRVASKSRDLKRVASKPREIKFSSSTTNKSNSRKGDVEAASAMEEGCLVWVRPDRTDNWVKAKIVSIAKYSPPVSAYRKPDLDAMKQSVFVLDVQDENDKVIDQIEVLSAPMPDSLEEYETVKLRNPEGDNNNQGSALNINDLTALSYLHEPAIMHCLHQRFMLDKIYTSTGPILLAVNPFKNLDIYSSKIVAKYRDAGATAKFNADIEKKLPPHPYQIADNAYRNMVSNALLNRSLLRSNPYGDVGLVAQNQSILVSGESGAGKTETTKFIMRYLADITKDVKDSSDATSRSIENQVLQSNPILECFGNARTLRNDNSSRFGKFIEINFSFGEKNDEIFRIASATIRTYLLEKVRIVRQAHGERNYHIFYELLSGYDPAHLRSLGLTDMSAFNYMNQSGMYERLDGVQDHEQFKRTVHALRVLGIDEDEQTSIWKIVAAILHVGNITFDVKAGGPGGEDDGSKISTSSQYHVTTCCKLLDLNEEKFVKALCVQKLVIPDKVLEKMVSTSGAEHNRDNFSKSMYGALFDWLVQRINRTIASGAVDDKKGMNSKNRCFIGVLDIFGFENFQVNSFEQLCINFTNETLQHHFNNFVFKHEQSLYEAEGIDWNFIKFPDNSDVLNLLEDRIVGVFAICDEQVRFPKATDITLIHKLYEKCSSHSRFFAGSKEKADNVFIVKHFAGPVKYSSISFLEKNQDVVRPELANVAQNSSSELVCELADFFRIDDALLNKANPLAVRKQSSRNIEPTKGSAQVTGLTRSSYHNRTKTLGGEFRGQMEELMSNINTTAPHYIRCLKPNSNNVGNEFDCSLIVSQLRCGGVLEAVRVSRAGYSKRFTFDEFFRRYCFYIGEKCPRARSYSQSDSTDLARKISSKALNVDEFVPSEDSLDQKDELRLMGIQVGSTSVFFRSRTFDFMERQKLLYHRRQAVKLQAHARKYNAVTNYRKIMGAIKVVQLATRVFLANRRVYRMKTFASIMLLQRVARGYLVRHTFRKMINGFRRLQSVCRASAERRRTRAMKKYNNAATVIQCFVRCRWANRELRQLRMDARDVEKVKLVVDDLKIKLSESAGKWKAEKVSIIAEFKAEFQSLSNSLQAVEKELAVANSRNEALSEELAMAKEDFQELDSEFAEYRENTLDKEYAEALEIDLNTVRDDLRQARERADLLEKDNVKIPEMKAHSDKLQAHIFEMEARDSSQKDQLQEQSEIIKSLYRDIENLSAKYNSINSQMMDFKSRYEEESEKSTLLARDKENIAADLQETKAEVVGYQHRQQNLEEKVQKLSRDYERASLEVEKSNVDVDEYKRRMNDLAIQKETEVSEKVSQLQTLEKELKRCMKSLQDSQEQQSHSQGEMSQAMQSLHEVVQNNRAELESIEAEHAEKVKGLDNAISALTRELEKSEEKCSQLSGDLKALMDSSQIEKARLHEDLSEANEKVQAKEREISQLSSQFSDLTNHLESTLAAAEELKGRNTKLENDVEERNALISTQIQNIEDANKNLDELQKDLTMLDENNRSLERKVKEMNNELKLKDDMYKKREKALEAGSENLLKDYENKRRDCNKLEAQVQDLVADLKVTKDDLERIRHDASEQSDKYQSKISDMSEQLENSEEQTQALQVELQTMKAEIDKLQKIDFNRQARTDGLEDELKNADGKLQEFENAIDQLHRENGALRKEILSKDNELKLKNDMFEKRKEALKSGAEDLLKDLENKQRDFDKLETEMQELSLNLDKRNEELNKAECRALELEEKLEATMGELHSIRSEGRGDASPEPDEVKKLKVDLEEKTQELQKKSLQHATIVEALEDQLMVLGEELDNIKEGRSSETLEKLKGEPSLMNSSITAGSKRTAAGIEDEFLSESIEHIQEKYIEKKAEVETLHIGLDSLLDEYKNSQNENNELVDILKSRDEMLLESVAVLEDRESALVQIKTLEEGVDSILQELMEVKREKDELQSTLDDSLAKQSILQLHLDELLKKHEDFQQDRNAKDNALVANEVKAELEKTMHNERVFALQNQLHEVEADRTAAKKEAAVLAEQLRQAEQQLRKESSSNYQDDVNDIKQLVKNLEDSLKGAVETNAKLRSRSDEFKDFDANNAGQVMRNGDSLIEHIERDISKCKVLSEWLIAEAQLSPSKALNYSTSMVQDGKSSVKRLRKAVKRDMTYLNNIGITDIDAAAIAEALDLESANERQNLHSPLFSLSPFAPRHYSRSTNGRLSLSPSIPLSRPVTMPHSVTSQIPQESHEEKKDAVDISSERVQRLAHLEAQALEAARVAAAASEEADRVAQLYHRRHSVDNGDELNRKLKKRDLRQEQEQVVKAQEKAYLAATRARDAFFLATTSD